MEGTVNGHVGISGHKSFLLGTLTEAIGLSGGQFFLGQYMETWNKQRGLSVKDVALAKPDEDLIQYLHEYWGVQLSCCTGVARRVLLRSLLADLVGLFYTRPDPNIQVLQSRLSDHSFNLKDFYCWLNNLEKRLARRMAQHSEESSSRPPAHGAR